MDVKENPYFLDEENGWMPDPKDIREKINSKTKAIVIINPNNPTGTYLDKNEMLLLRKKLRNNILLVVDDAYFEFVINKDYVSGLD